MQTSEREKKENVHFLFFIQASRKRNLLGLNIKESPASLYHIAPIKKYPNPRRALKELQHPQPGLAVSNYVQTNDFLEKVGANYIYRSVMGSILSLDKNHESERKLHKFVLS